MKNEIIVRQVLASLAVGTLFGSSQLMADVSCFDVKGKIVNSFHQPALGGGNPPALGVGVSTLGVVALNAGPLGKMKCALAGVATNVDADFNPTEFDHTISCDDDVPIDGEGTVHSQLTFDTWVTSVTEVDTCTDSFTETSVPQSGTGLGVFSGVTDGGLSVAGTINRCTGSVDMKFTGQVCY